MGRGLFRPLNVQPGGNRTAQRTEVLVFETSDHLEHLEERLDIDSAPIRVDTQMNKHIRSTCRLKLLLLPLASITPRATYSNPADANPPCRCLYRCHWPALPAVGDLRSLLLCPSRGPTSPSPNCASRPASADLGSSPNGTLGIGRGVLWRMRS